MTEAAFAETVKRGGTDLLLDRIGRIFGLFGSAGTATVYLE